MKFIYLLSFFLWQVIAPPSPASSAEVDEVEHISNLSLHINHYKEFYQTPLLEIVEVGEEHHSQQNSRVAISSLFGNKYDGLPTFKLPRLNPVHLQRVQLPLYRVHGNFRL